MELKKELMANDMKAKLSTLWIFVLLNMIFRDIHEIARLEYLEEMMTRNANGVQITEEMFLLAGILLEILILMVVLSRLLPYRLNRWANIVAGFLAVASIVLIGEINDLDDIFFAAVEVVALAFIIWSAWRWTGLERSAELSSRTVSKFTSEQSPDYR